MTFNFNCLVLGEDEVGKTSLCRCYFFDETIKSATSAPASTTQSRGSQKYSAKVRIQEQEVQLTVWEISNTLADLQDTLLKSVDVVLLTFDMMQKKSFTSVKEKWAAKIKRANETVPVLLIGSKADLWLEKKRALASNSEQPESQEERLITLQEAREFSKASDFVGFFPTTSASTERIAVDVEEESGLEGETYITPAKTIFSYVLIFSYRNAVRKQQQQQQQPAQASGGDNTNLLHIVSKLPAQELLDVLPIFLARKNMYTQLLNGLKAKEEKIITFVTHPQVLSKLLQFLKGQGIELTIEDDDDKEGGEQDKEKKEKEKESKKEIMQEVVSLRTSEILTTEVNELLDALVETKNLTELFQFLLSSPLSSSSASVSSAEETKPEGQVVLRSSIKKKVNIGLVCRTLSFLTNQRYSDVVAFFHQTRSSQEEGSIEPFMRQFIFAAMNSIPCAELFAELLQGEEKYAGLAQMMVNGTTGESDSNILLWTSSHRVVDTFLELFCKHSETIFLQPSDVADATFFLLNKFFSFISASGPTTAFSPASAATAFFTLSLTSLLSADSTALNTSTTGSAAAAAPKSPAHLAYIIRQINSNEQFLSIFLEHLFSTNSRKLSNQDLVLDVGLKLLLLNRNKTEAPLSETAQLENPLVRLLIKGDYLLNLKKRLQDDVMLETANRKAVGFDRVIAVRLVCVLLHLRYSVINKRLIEHEIIQKVIELFFEFHQNSVLHTQVVELLSFLLDTQRTDVSFMEQFLVSSRLIDRISGSFFSELNLISQALPAPVSSEEAAKCFYHNLIAKKKASDRENDKWVQKGFFGHVCKIVSLLVSLEKISLPAALEAPSLSPSPASSSPSPAPAPANVSKGEQKGSSETAQVSDAAIPSSPTIEEGASKPAESSSTPESVAATVADVALDPASNSSSSSEVSSSESTTTSSPTEPASVTPQADQSTSTPPSSSTEPGATLPPTVGAVAAPADTSNTLTTTIGKLFDSANEWKALREPSVLGVIEAVNQSTLPPPPIVPPKPRTNTNWGRLLERAGAGAGASAGGATASAGNSGVNLYLM